MPIYEFFCGDCKKPFEVLCSIRTDLKTIVCANCSGKNVAKKVSSFSTIGGGGDKETGSAPHSHSHSSSCGSCSTHSCGSCHH